MGERRPNPDKDLEPMEMTWQTVKAVLREVLREELDMGVSEITPRYAGGTLEFRPSDTALKSKEVPVEAFFRKITSVREKLRVLEQKVNNHPRLNTEDRVELQALITRCYGSLTTFNFLFRDEEDHFAGMKGE
jgi:hypothetical protein